MDISNNNLLVKNLKSFKIIYVIHLAAQAGVRYSFSNPNKYIKSNIDGFNNILELCRKRNIENIFFASSSSVYGDQNKFPINENAKLNPVSFYGVTKLINEELAKSYSFNFNLNSTALRFFTVYGPFGRPDMALYKFVDALKKDKHIEVFNFGNHLRDFSYIDDVVNALFKLIKFRLNNKKNKTQSKFMALNIAKAVYKNLHIL